MSPIIIWPYILILPDTANALTLYLEHFKIIIGTLKFTFRYTYNEKQ
jgi:hypothetical protein